MSSDTIDGFVVPTVAGAIDLVVYLRVTEVSPLPVTLNELRTIRALREDGFDGFFSLEPHLGSAHALGGFSGPDLFMEAHRDFTAMLHAEQIPFG